MLLSAEDRAELAHRASFTLVLAPGADLAGALSLLPNGASLLLLRGVYSYSSYSNYSRFSSYSNGSAASAADPRGGAARGSAGAFRPAAGSSGLGPSEGPSDPRRAIRGPLPSGQRPPLLAITREVRRARSKTLCECVSSRCGL